MAMNTARAASGGHRRRHQAGMSLIEVLVAILVVALGILTMVVMQVNATKMTKTSEVRTMAALLVGDLSDRMRANPDGFVLNAYETRESTDAPPTFSRCLLSDIKDSCTPAQIAQQDLSDWLNGLRFAMPNGTARVSKAEVLNNKNGVDVWLVWIDPEDRGDADAPNLSPSACPSDLSVKSDKAPVRCMYFRINI